MNELSISKILFEMKLLAFVSFQLRVRNKTVCRQLRFYAPLSLSLTESARGFQSFYIGYKA